MHGFRDDGCVAGAHEAKPNPKGGGMAWTLQGWHNPSPISISIHPEQLAILREGVRRDLEALMPRCAALDRSLPENKRRHKGYVASKIQHNFPLAIRRERAGDRAVGTIQHNRAYRTRSPAVAAADITLSEALRRTRSILTVGGITDPGLLTLLAERHTAALVPGDGVMTTTISGHQRPAADGFSAWMAAHDEAERASVGAIVLGRSAGRADVELLRYRLHGHQRVIAETGSVALAWLLAEWDGGVRRFGDLIVFEEPGNRFREPSRLTYLASENDWPKISVITVSYNQREYLEQCLLSVLDQRYPNLEYIVIDACSTDGSIDILRRHEARLSRLVIEPDDGQSDGLNKGFNLATGDILTWVNSDDMLAPLALKRAALAFAESGADMVAGTCSRVAGADARPLYRHHSVLPTARCVTFDLAGPLNWRDAWERGDYFFQPEVFFSRDIWTRAGGYLRAHLYWAMDWDLWLRFALAGATVFRIPDVLAVSREHEAQKTTTEEMYLWQIATLLTDYDALLDLLERDTVAP
jgi:GT2 family glycosyltransferase